MFSCHQCCQLSSGSNYTIFWNLKIITANFVLKNPNYGLGKDNLKQHSKWEKNVSWKKSCYLRNTRKNFGQNRVALNKNGHKSDNVRSIWTNLGTKVRYLLIERNSLLQINQSYSASKNIHELVAISGPIWPASDGFLTPGHYF